MKSIRTLAMAAVLAVTAGPVLAQSCVSNPSDQCTVRLPNGPYSDYVGPSGGNIYCAAVTAGQVQVDRYTVLGQGGYSCTYFLPCSVLPPGNPLLVYCN